jgi:hypothetical protein
LSLTRNRRRRRLQFTLPRQSPPIKWVRSFAPLQVRDRNVVVVVDRIVGRVNFERDVVRAVGDAELGHRAAAQSAFELAFDELFTQLFVLPTQPTTVSFPISLFAVSPLSILQVFDPKKPALRSYALLFDGKRIISGFLAYKITSPMTPGSFECLSSFDSCCR